MTEQVKLFVLENTKNFAELIQKYVDFNAEFQITALVILLCPLIWNVVARTGMY